MIHIFKYIYHYYYMSEFSTTQNAFAASDEHHETDIGHYTIEELISILNLSNPTQKEITDKTDFYINKFNRIKAEQGARRRAHFAAGGTPATWRGRSACLDESTSKARKNKKACRGRMEMPKWM